MARGSCGRIILDCPFCGVRYVRTNFMIRRPPALVWHAGRHVRLSDTHLISCHARIAKPRLGV